MGRKRSLLRLATALLALTVTALFAVGWGSSGPIVKLSISNRSTAFAQNVALAQGGTATWAEPAGMVPNYIFPINSCCFTAADREHFQQLLYRPLYWFGTNGNLSLNQSLSLASPPSYNGDTVVVNMKNTYLWANGEHVDAADVVFFMNMLKVVKNTGWGGYVPGFFPDNVQNVEATGTYQVTFHLDRAYNAKWFTYNELSQITPFPIAWDVTQADAAAASGGCSAATYASITATSSGGTSCQAVYDFLTGQAKTLGTYASNPLWQVVDGPWTLSSFDETNGDADFVPNTAYTGPQKPSLTEFKERGFTSDSAEFNKLQTGSAVSVGYLPIADVPSKTKLDGLYTLAPLYDFRINYVTLNLADKTGDADNIFKQLYIRQALQHLVDQQALISSKGISDGFAVQDDGPVPPKPNSPYLTSGDETNPYPYSVSTASELLTSHGWKVVPGGITTCEQPGTAANECGAGIPAGTALTFGSLRYASSPAYVGSEVEVLASAAKQVGITFTLKAQTPTYMWVAAAAGGHLFAPDHVPTGESLFYCGALANAGSYCDPTGDTDIESAARDGASNLTQSLATDASYIAGQAPVIFLPVTESLTEIATHLQGVTPQNVYDALTPEDWAWEQGFVPGS